MHGSVTRALKQLRNAHSSASGADDELSAQLRLDRDIRSFLLDVIRKRRTSRLNARIETEGVYNEAFRVGIDKVRGGCEIQNRDDFRAFVTRVAILTLLQEIRFHDTDKRGGKLHHQSDDLSPIETRTAEKIDALEEVDSRDLLEKITAEIQDLGDFAIRIVEMRIEEDASWLAIGRALGIRRWKVAETVREIQQRVRPLFEDL